MKVDPKRLAELHVVVTEYLIAAIMSGNADSKTLDSAVRFLKDNNINADMSGSAEERQASLRSILSDLPKFENEEEAA